MIAARRSPSSESKLAMTKQGSKFAKMVSVKAKKKSQVTVSFAGPLTTSFTLMRFDANAELTKGHR